MVAAPGPTAVSSELPLPGKPYVRDSARATPGCFFARPKSRILIRRLPRPASTTNRLAGLMSRWMIPLACAAAKADAACWLNKITSSLVNPFPPAFAR